MLLGIAAILKPGRRSMDDKFWNYGSWKYWVLLMGKILVVASMAWALGWWDGRLMPAPNQLLAHWSRLGTDWPYTLVMPLCGLASYLLLRLALWDQKFRCRVCVRRLRLPQAEGIYSSVLLGGTPYCEYVCTWGHGKLFVPELHLASSGKPMWTGYESLWDNLLRAEEAAVEK